MAVVCPTKITTSLTQSFSKKEAEQQEGRDIIIMEALESTFLDKRVQVFTKAGIQKVASTYGTVQSLGTAVRDFEEALVWNGEFEKDLGNPNPVAGSVDLETIGDFLNALTGAKVNPNFLFDETLGKIKCSEKQGVYGGSFLRFSANCSVFRIVYPPNIELSDIPKDIIVLAINNENKVAALTLSKGDLEVKFTENGSERLGLGIDLISNANAKDSSGNDNGQPSRSFGVKVYPYPNMVQESNYLAFSQGERIAVNEPIGHTNSASMLKITEFLMFANSEKVNLKYPPMSASGAFSTADVEITAKTEFINELGQTFNPTFLYPGETLTLSDNSLVELGRTQIAVVDEAARLLNATGSIRIDYQVPYKNLYFYVPYTHGTVMNEDDSKLLIELTVKDGLDVVTMSSEIQVPKVQTNIANRKIPA